MSRDCFSLILKFPHINDKKDQKQKSEPGYDPLYKMRPLLALRCFLNALLRSESMYNLENTFQNVSNDCFDQRPSVLLMHILLRLSTTY